MKYVITQQFRVKDSNSKGRLEAHARAVNYVWNYLCNTQRHAMAWRRKWPSSYELKKLVSGCSGELNIQALTIESVVDHFVNARDTRKKCPRYRGRRSLPWVPFRLAWQTIKIDRDTVVYRKKKYRLWLHRPIDGSIKDGSFARDARGRWYLNVQVEREATPDCGDGVLGVDLGLKDLASLSDGTKIENPRQFSQLQDRLANAQRAGRKKRAAAIHAKIANRRRDYLHKQSIKIIRRCGTIVVGDVNSAQLKQTSMGKSVSDASWSTFRGMLRYKAIAHGAKYLEVDERFTSQTCSSCYARSGPKGRKGLRVRQWTCSECGSVHDRDTNAAKLIAGAAVRPLFGEMLKAQQGLTPTSSGSKND